MSPPDGAWDSVVDQAKPADQPTSNDNSWDNHVDAAATQSDGQISGWKRYPAFAASELAAGVAAVPDIPRTISGALDIPLTWAANKLTGNNLPTPQAFVGKNSPIPLPSATGITNALGVTNRPDLKPTGLGENLLSAGVRALPLTAAEIASGGAATPAIASNLGSSLAAEGAHQAMPDSTLVPILAGAATGFGFGKFFQARQATKEWQQINKDLPASQQAAADADANLKAAREQKIDSLREVKDTHAQQVNASLADRDAFIQQANNDRRLGLEAQQQSLGASADKLGNSQTVADAGAQLQNSTKNWLGNTLPAKLKSLWAPLDKAIPESSPVDLPSFRGTLGNINTQAGGLEFLAKDLKPGLPAKWLDRFKARDELGDVAEGQAPAPITWGDVSTFRTMLGDAMHNPVMLKDIGEKNLSQMYAGLTSDMQRVAKGQGLSQAFDAANAGSKALFQKAENVFSKVTESANDTGGKLPGAAAAGFLARGAKDGSELQTLRDEVPEAADHLAAVAIRTGGWKKLSPDAQAALIPDPARRAEVTFGFKATDDINDAANLAVQTAKNNHEANVALAGASKQGSARDAEDSFRGAKTAKEAAEARLAELQDKFNSLAKAREPTDWHSIKSGMLGGGIGYSAAHWGSSALESMTGIHGISPTAAALSLGTLTYGIPKIAKGLTGVARDLINNPASQRATGLGATIGSAWQPAPQQADQKNALGASQ